MATIRIRFRPSVVSDKEGALYFQVIHKRVSRMINTGYHIKPCEWDADTSFIRITGDNEQQTRLLIVAHQLQWCIRRLTAFISEKETARIEYSADDIIAAYRRLPQCQSWFCFIRSMADKKAKTGRHGTAKTYRDALNSFARFREGKDIAIEALDNEEMTMYEAWLKSNGLKRNSSSCYLRTLRTLYRKATDMGLTTDRHIFRHVFTGFAKTSKRAISLSSVRTIRRLSLPEGSPLAFARDVFMLSLYLQGMAFIDMAYLKKSDIRNGQLQYARKKTRQSLTIGWEPPMQSIIDEYAHLTTGSPYLLPIITKPDGTERRQYEKMEHNINRNLKKIGYMAGLQIPLTTYVARHTWASTMRDMGCDLSIVSTGLGHENLKTTQIYLSTIDTAAVTKANRKMIGMIIKQKENKRKV